MTCLLLVLLLLLVGARSTSAALYNRLEQWRALGCSGTVTFSGSPSAFTLNKEYILPGGVDCKQRPLHRPRCRRMLA